MVDKPKLHRLSKDEIDEYKLSKIDSDTILPKIDTLKELGDTKQIISLIEFILPSLDSKDLTMQSLLGSLYLEDNNLDSAYTIFDKLIELDNNNVRAFLGRAKVFYQWKSYKDSLDDIDRVLGLSPELEEALLLRDVLVQKMHYSMGIYG